MAIAKNHRARQVREIVLEAIRDAFEDEFFLPVSGRRRMTTIIADIIVRHYGVTRRDDRFHKLTVYYGSIARRHEDLFFVRILQM